MESTWQFQIRITVADERASALRADPASDSYPPLREILRRHKASLKCQFDAFADYVKEAEAMGTSAYRLYEWTRQTIENPEKKAKYLRSFTVYVEGQEVYDKAIADSLAAALSALPSDAGIERVFKYDTNPANNPQPPQANRG
ncbi:hypothetical protein GCT13_22820 [Paraburkholderia sp. CNPSo 3157]|uniref:Uncharacterized protein n=1 Tax=Paraburkholderia franconis TaxID=2654983 RepID=A0A7X1ND37_9BURK|nr:hypothetical protein [Paraburkholderia franconis]MPW19654.1 hypothetical protein [Paraburkholderia franconis]